MFPDLPEHWKDEHKRCFGGEIIKKEEEPFPRADGTTDWVRRELCPWRDTSGRIGGLIMFTEVITKRRQIEKALKDSEEHYADLDRRRELLRLLNENGRVDGFEIMSIRPDGTHTEIAVSAIIYPEYGYIEGCIIDMTEKKRAAREKEQLQAKLQQAQKMEAIGTLAGGIAHDFNNLPMGIQGRTSLILADIRPDHPHFEHLTEIENYVGSAAELTRQLLGFARGANTRL